MTSDAHPVTIDSNGSCSTPVALSSQNSSFSTHAVLVAEKGAPVDAADIQKELDNAAFIARHGRLRRPIDHPAFDPFRRTIDGLPWTFSDYWKAVVGIFLIPIRLASVALILIVSYTLVLLCGPGRGESSTVTAATAEEPDPCLPQWRRNICMFANKLLGRGLLFTLGFWYVNGRDDPGYKHKEASKATIVSNHVSLADPCLLAYLFAPSFVAKKAVGLIPLVGRVGAAQHAFYIDRMASSGPSTTDIIARRQRMLTDRAGTTLPPVAIFPEATTTSGNLMLRFRTGAFVAGTPVAPVILRYPHVHFSPSYESIKTVPYLCRMLSQFSNNVEYLRLPVYYPNEAEKADPRLYADNVLRLMVDKSDFLPGTKKFKVSNSCYTDKIEYHSLIRSRPLGKNIKLT